MTSFAEKRAGAKRIHPTRDADESEGGYRAVALSFGGEKQKKGGGVGGGGGLSLGERGAGPKRVLRENSKKSIYTTQY